ncbi:MAG: cob(I)yrinic acid a,c-diamide adenosyltransferase [Dehalococcoidia bacterium]
MFHPPKALYYSFTSRDIMATKGERKMKTFNKRGDKGETSLLYGGRVPKSDPRCEAYGTIDEAVSALGLARALAKKERVSHILLSIQQELFIVGAELATAADKYHKLKAEHRVVTAVMVDRLESLIDGLEGEMEMPKAFVIPGVSPCSAALDLARTIIRRAERRVVELRKDNMVQNERALEYLNRLADLIFTLARYEEI